MATNPNTTTTPYSSSRPLPPSPTALQVIMATNRADTLDPALLRPGRLDRKIEFPLPDRRQKRLIFQVNPGVHVCVCGGGGGVCAGVCGGGCECVHVWVCACVCVRMCACICVCACHMWCECV